MKIVIEFKEEAEQSDVEFYADNLPVLDPEDDKVASIRIIDETIISEEIKE